MKRAHQAHRDQDHALGTLLEYLAAQLRALTAERDRAERAEARLREVRRAMDMKQTVDGVTDRGWLTPDEWILDKVGEALGDDEATA